MSRTSIPLTLLAVASLFGASGCGRQSADIARSRSDPLSVAPLHDDSPDAAPNSVDAAEPSSSAEGRASTEALRRPDVSQAPVGPSTLNAAPLPEDPDAGARAEAQWREHLAKEEEERQVGFDRRRLKEHRALIRRFKATRARIQAARTLPAIAKLQSELPQQIEQLRGGIQQVDPWGVSSRLLPDYRALATLLGGTYGEAKAEALRGQPAALAEANTDFDKRLKHMEELLEEAAESEETY